MQQPAKMRQEPCGPMLLSMYPLLHGQLQVWLQLPLLSLCQAPSCQARTRQRRLQKTLFRKFLPSWKQMQILSQFALGGVRVQFDGQMQVFCGGVSFFSRQAGGREHSLFFQPDGGMQERQLREQAQQRKHHQIHILLGAHLIVNQIYIKYLSPPSIQRQSYHQSNTNHTINPTPIIPSIQHQLNSANYRQASSQVLDQPLGVYLSLSRRAMMSICLLCVRCCQRRQASSTRVCWCSSLTFLRYFNSYSCLLLPIYSSFILNQYSLIFLSFDSPIFCRSFTFITLSTLEQLQISSFENASYFMAYYYLSQSIHPKSVFNFYLHPSFTPSSLSNFFCTCFSQGWSRISAMDSLASGLMTSILVIMSLQGLVRSDVKWQLRLMMLLLILLQLRVLFWRSWYEKGLEPVVNSQMSTPRLHTSTRQS